MLFGDRVGVGVYVCVFGGVGWVVWWGWWRGFGGEVYNDILMHNLFEWSVTDSLHCIDIV